jgi:DNA topoisomerase-1
MLEFSELLPVMRERIEQAISLPGLPRQKILATVVRLLEKTLIRVGNDEYARENRSYGLTTLKRRHVEVSGTTLHFEFRGKSGVEHTVSITDRRIARIVQHCQTLPGEELFQYLDEEGKRQSVDSGDINEYLREIAGRDVTAKDFRTWAGTMLASTALRELGPAESEREAKKKIVLAVDRVARRLGNTRAVCRKYYVHPTVFERYMQGEVLPPVPPTPAERVSRPSHELRRLEAEVLAFITNAPEGGKPTPPAKAASA